MGCILTFVVTTEKTRFRWVDCQLDDLREQIRPADIRETLDNLPSGLHETYRRILEKIRKVPNRWEIARKIFMWLICCKRPLSLDELAVAVAIDSEDKIFNDAKRVFRNEQLLEICISFIRLDKDGTKVEFTHFSIVEYLTTRFLDGQENDYFVDARSGHAQLMSCCLTYFSFPRTEDLRSRTHGNFFFMQQSTGHVTPKKLK